MDINILLFNKFNILQFVRALCNLFNDKKTDFLSWKE